MTEADLNNLQLAKEVLQEALAVMERFPPGFVPDTARPEALTGQNFDDVLANPEAVEALQSINARWPDGLLASFLTISALIPQFLRMWGWQSGDPASRIDLLQAAAREPEIMRLMQTYSETTKVDAERGAPHNAVDPMQIALHSETMRRAAALATPFAHTISTLLGPDTPKWFLQATSRQEPNIQPHEFSRIGWPRLDRIQDQIAIEQELFRFGRDSEPSAKCIVACCWGLCALASFLEPCVFLPELEPRITSMRDEGLTATWGKGVNTLISFDPASMIAMTNVVIRALDNPEITACDLMWIANGLARRREIIVTGPSAQAVQSTQKTYSVFLSHRGMDAKAALVQLLQARHGDSGVFLDCVTLPRGLINRAFVFGSLARSRAVIVVDTPHFHQSPWCRKELWFAETMASLGLARLSRVGLNEVAQLLPATAAPPAREVGSDAEFSYRMVRRILLDQEESAMRAQHGECAQA